MICNLNSITELERLLEHERRKLQAEDIPMVKKILSELVEKKDSLFKIDSNKFCVEKIGSIQYRIKFYLSSKIEIRVNIFLKKDEDIIHQHGLSFISTCLIGSYDHCLYTLQSSDSDYFAFERKENGVFLSPVAHKGTWVKICSQQFDAGQSLFLSPFAFHTVSIKEYPMITLVLRDREDTIQSVKFIDTKNFLTDIPVITTISDEIEAEKVFNFFLKFLEELPGIRQEV
jgi:hypothetical protein